MILSTAPTISSKWTESIASLSRSALPLISLIRPRESALLAVLPKNTWTTIPKHAITGVNQVNTWERIWYVKTIPHLPLLSWA